MTRQQGVRIPAGLWKGLLTALIGGGSGFGLSRATATADGAGGVSPVRIEAIVTDVANLRTEVRVAQTKSEGIEKALDKVEVAVRELAAEVRKK